VPDPVSDHYASHDLADRIFAALKAAGRNPDAPTIDDLAAVDHFHIRGRAATEELGRWSEIRPEHLLLDVGSGLGGTSRYLASTYGCRTVGIDLTPEYVRTAEVLSQRVGLAGRTVFVAGDATDLPFGARHFDVAWTEHVQMNISDKGRFYGEISRVLKPGGRFAFHDVFAGEEGGMEFPVPWATGPAISHLVGIGPLREILAAAGFVPVRWEDKTLASVDFFRERLSRGKSGGRKPPGLDLLMGDGAPDRFANLLRNLEKGRLRVVQALMTREG